MTRAERKARDVAEGNIVKLTPPKVAPMDPASEWSDVPSVAEQCLQEGMWRPKGREARVFNLSDDAQMAKYNELLALCDKPNTNCFITSEVTQFDQTKGVFITLVKLSFVEYKKIFKKEKA